MSQRKNIDLNKLESISKIIGTLAIPIVLVILGWQVQKSLNFANISKDYVQLAVSILKEPKKDGDELLREWAVDLLNANSPVKISYRVAEGLKNGKLALPSTESGMELIAEESFDVMASATGRVSRVDKDSNGIYTIDLDHGSLITTRYKFLAEDIFVTVGQQVTKGQKIGLIKKLPNSSKGILVFEMLLDGKQVNPKPYLKDK